MAALNENSKRPKLENPNNTSTTSTTTKSSTPSSLSREASLDSRTRVSSLGPLPGPWFPSEPAPQAPPPPTTRAQSSPGGPSSTLPGYRDTVINPSPQTLAWRDHTRPPDLPIHGYNRQVEPKLNQSGILNGPETPTSFAQAFHNQPRSLSSISVFSPPSLTSESTASTVSTQLSTSSSSAADTRQSTYFAPRIPLDPSRDRPSFPMHPVFSGTKPPAHFDNQLPPMRHPSLSPQLSAPISYNSPSGASRQYLP